MAVLLPCVSPTFRDSRDIREQSNELAGHAGCFVAAVARLVALVAFRAGDRGVLKVVGVVADVSGRARGVVRSRAAMTVRCSSVMRPPPG
jgi:hypothetical protein